ncbi:hypothetical protein GCM10025868_34270 [Angustibacter aerolatus]|uniref:Phage shock protein PspC N-terminal domain-containing protein n=1 Tax=Angustibacter aerolatus TaxID=1162965 RepID=A0ABQ6JK84_9ACTN|nr:PspC domain-containing protein [Angustibacter aerolatus]GMA88177.1 hypothetical protein GCM10025868_34270 [Angustibacter aerolatus]
MAGVLRGLRRSRSERMAAGVAGGVARSLGLDPLLLRIVLVVLVFFGGAGLVLYAAGWLLLPVDDGEPSIGQQVVQPGPRRPSTQTVLLAVALALVAFGSLLAAFDHWDGGLLFVLAVAGLVLLLVRREGVQVGWNPSRPAAAASGSPVPPAATASAPYGPQPAPGTAFAASAPAPAGPLLAPRGSTPQPPYQPPYQPPVAFQPPPPTPRRERSLLGRLTVSLVLILLGVLISIDLAGGDLPGVVYVAAPLALVGVALIVGTFVGRARGLIALGILLSIACGAVVAGQRIGDGVGDPNTVRRTPTTVAEPAARRRLRPGRGVLRPARHRPGRHRREHVGRDQRRPRRGHRAGGPGRAGSTRASGSAGSTPSGRTWEDLAWSLNVSDDGTDDVTGGGTLHLHLGAGVGRLEVHRAQA